MTDTFRNLVTNRYMPGFDYNTSFEFDTVFYKTGYSYACCACAFQHEFLTYISDGGVIDENVYKDIIGSIVLGKCPHVRPEIPAEWVVPTSVYGLQLAVALGTTQAEEENRDRCIVEKRKSVFHLSLHNIALMMKKYHYFTWYCKKYFSEAPDDNVYFCYQSKEDVNKYTVKKISHIEALVHTEDIRLIEAVLNLRLHLGRTMFGFATLDRNIGKAGLYLGKRGLTKIYSEVSVYERSVSYLAMSHATAPSILASIVYNRLDMFRWVLPCVTQNDGNCMFWRSACNIFQRKEFLKLMLKRHLIHKSDRVTVKKYIDHILSLLDCFPDFSDEIIAVLKEVPHAQHECIDVLSRTLGILKSSRVVKAILQLGPENFDLTFLSKILIPDNDGNKVMGSKETMKTLKILLHANIDIGNEKELVEAVLNYEWLRLLGRNFRRHGLFIADAKLRGRFSHEDRDLVLNLKGPLLMESGFFVSRGFLTDLMDRLSGDKTEGECLREYIKQYLDDTPRSLVVMCRKVLRNYFRGRRLHAYIESIECSPRIKDFVLMTSLLKTE